MSNILVTGGAGFIGSHLVDKLIELNHNVVIIDNLSTGDIKNVNPTAEFQPGNINNEVIIADLFDEYKFDYCFHLAAQINLRKSITDPRFDAEVNIMGSLNIIEQCVKHKVKIIFSSTGGAIYSPDAELPFTEATLAQPSSPYGLGKLTVENYLQIMKNIYGLDYVALRYSNVYGPRQNAHGEAGVIAIFIDRLSVGKDITIYGDGNQTRDFVYVSDVVQANINALNLSGVFNVSSNLETSVNYIANTLVQKINPNTKIIYAPKVEGEMTRCRLSYDKLMNTTWWKPVHSFDIGLEKTIGVK